MRPVSLLPQAGEDALDGLGLRGEGWHTPTEFAELATAPELIKRTAVLIHRLTR